MNSPVASPLSNTKQITVDGVPYVLRTRIFQPKDDEAVHRLYIVAMVTGPGSPMRFSFRKNFTDPFPVLAYTLALLGIATTFYPYPPSPLSTYLPTLLDFWWLWHYMIATTLFTSSVTIFVGSFLYIYKQFVDFIDLSFKDDLLDIPRHYKLIPPPSSSSPMDVDTLIATGVSAFWVAEVRRADSEEWEIVGTVALDDSVTDGEAETSNLRNMVISDDDSDKTLHAKPRSAELRRMTVSPYHRRMGIAGMLLRALVEHAKSCGVEGGVTMTTTQYQLPAQRLYEKHGWVVEGRATVWSGYAYVEFVSFRREFGKGS